MALQTLTTLSNALFRDYDKVIRSQIFSKTVALSNLKRNVGVTPMKNNTFYIKTASTGHSGVYFDNGAAGSDLSTGQPTYDEPSVSARFGFGTHQITDTALDGIDGDPAAVVDTAEDFSKQVRLSMQRSLNRQFYQRGGTEANNAVVATVNGASTGTTVTLDNGPTDTNTEGPALGTWYLYEGSLIDIGTDTEHGAGTDDQETVSTVDSATQITIAASATVADGDHVKFRDGDNNEMNGMRSIADDDNSFQGVTRSSSYWAQAYVDETAEALSEGDMVDAFLEAQKFGSVNAILVGRPLYKKYSSLLTSMKRTSTPQQSLLGGFTGLEFAAGGTGQTVMLDYDCPYGDVNFVTFSPDALVMGEMGMGWMNRGEGIFKATSLRASYWATYKFYGNYIARNFKAHSRLGAKTT